MLINCSPTFFSNLLQKSVKIDAQKNWEFTEKSGNFTEKTGKLLKKVGVQNY